MLKKAPKAPSQTPALRKKVQVEFVRLASISRPRVSSELSDGQESLPDWSQAASRGTNEDVISGVKAAACSVSCRASASAAAV